MIPVFCWFPKTQLLRFHGHTRKLQYEALGLGQPPYNKLSQSRSVHTHTLILPGLQGRGGWQASSVHSKMFSLCSSWLLWVWARQKYVNQRPRVLTGSCSSSAHSHECVAGQHSPHQPSMMDHLLPRLCSYMGKKKMDGMSERRTSKQDRKKNHNHGDISSVNISKVIGKLKTIGNVIASSSKKKNVRENTLDDWAWLRGDLSHPTAVKPLHTLQIWPRTRPQRITLPEEDESTEIKVFLQTPTETRAKTLMLVSN